MLRSNVSTGIGTVSRREAAGFLQTHVQIFPISGDPLITIIIRISVKHNILNYLKNYTSFGRVREKSSNDL